MCESNQLSYLKYYPEKSIHYPTKCLHSKLELLYQRNHLPPLFSQSQVSRVEDGVKTKQYHGYHIALN